MNPIRSLKRAVARRLERSPTLLENMGKKAEVFEKILVGVAKSEKAVTRIIDSPAVLDRMMRSPKVFDRLLTEVSRNPEGLYRVLNQRNVRRNLKAQNTFLKGVASEKVAVAKIMANIPARDRAELVASIVAENTSMLRELTDVPDALATALLYQMGTSKKNVPQYSTSQKVIIEKLLENLDEKSTSVVSALAQQKPDLFKKGTLRAQAIRALIADEDGLAELCVLYAATPANGPTTAERSRKLLERVLSQPVFLQAMIHDETLRNSVAQIVQDCAGEAPTKSARKTRKRA